jgi:hypothetical protein
LLLLLPAISVQGAPTVADAPGSIYLPLVLKPDSAPGTVPEPPPAGNGIWISAAELAQLPTSGPAWDHLQETADAAASTPDLSDQDTDANVEILAKALVFARTGEPQYRTEVIAALQVITFNNTEDGGRTLALGRELAAYVVAADLINLAEANPGLDAQFRAKLRELLTKPLDGWGSDQRTLVETHELRPNNWGTHAGASRAAVAVYLGDEAELARTAQVFRGYLGDLSAYNEFEFGSDLSWQADPAHPVGLNPVGATKEGHSIDGALPEEMRRGGPFQWPPLETNYPWEGLQGALVQAMILHRAGYPAWEWEDQALLRAVEFLYSIDGLGGVSWVPEGDDRWLPWLVNAVYQTDYPTETEIQPGKNMGWTDWTHAP